MFNKENIQQLGALLKQRKETIAVAESVTGGFLQAALSTAESASLFFQGGLTAYNITQKYTHLQIDLANAAACNCVSEQTATEMAMAITTSFASHWGVGITGYASPVPGRMNELFAWYAIVFDHKLVKTGTFIAPIEDPVEVQIEYTDQLIALLLEVVTAQHGPQS